VMAGLATPGLATPGAVMAGALLPEELNAIRALPELTDAPLRKQWTSLGTVPFGYRGGGFGFAIGDTVYVGSGEHYDEIGRDFWAYDPAAQTWTCLAEIPARTFSGITFTLGNKGYAGLGTEIGTSSGKFTKHMFQYDPHTNSWRRLHDFPGTPRIDAIAFVIGSKAYAGTGYDGTNTSDFYAYDPAKDEWKRVADFPGGGLHASVGIGLGDRGFLIAGGRAPVDFKFVYEYIPATDQWIRKSDLPGAGRDFHCGGYVDSNYLIAGAGGSYEAGVRLRDFYLYDVRRDAWSALPDYPNDVRGNSRPIGATVMGKVYLGTGFDGSYTNDWNVFDYYFTVRKTAGTYDERVGYPLIYDGRWQLFQECDSNDCHAGMGISCGRDLGRLWYSSRFGKDVRVLSADRGGGANLFLFPRNFSIRTDKQPVDSAHLRLFFTRRELEAALNECNRLSGRHSGLGDVQVLQWDQAEPDTDPFNNTLKGRNKARFIRPHWYSYGIAGETIVAEFPVTTLHSEFYLSLRAD
jgi:N-acetylneuraminic acid mutarotase